MQVFQAADDAASGWQTLQLAKLQTAPQIIYTSSRADASFIEHLQQPFEALTGHAEDMQSITPQVRLEKAAMFGPEQVGIRRKISRSHLLHHLRAGWH